VTAHIIHCGPLPAVDHATHILNPTGASATVNIDLSGIELAAARDLLPLSRDLMVLAAYVLLADGALSRGRHDDPVAKKWRRDLTLHVPVSEPDLWRAAKSELAELLEFATDDSWKFEFRPSVDDRQLRLSLASIEPEPPTCVTMFSGGLDSTAGTLRLIDAGERPILVSHWTTNVGKVHREAVRKRLREVRPAWRFPNPTLHTMREAGSGDAADYSQRSRGVLYLSAGVAVAIQAGLGRLVVAENGVTSLNLAQSGQSVGAMRSRTTHPKTLALFRLLIDRLGLPVSVETPLAESTKGEVIDEVINRGGEPLAHATFSCAKSMFSPRAQPHCGTCSQCVDRRFAGVWAGWDDAIERQQHAVDLFRDELLDGEPAMYAEQYIRFATDMLDLSFDDFVSRHDVWRASQGAADPAAEMDRFFDLERRHARQIEEAYGEVLKRNQHDLLAGKLPAKSLLPRLGRFEHRREDWARLADRIAQIVSPALRKTLAGRAPKDEDELQRLIDGIASAAELRLAREVPTIRFGVVRTRPDFSRDAAENATDLYVEVKLVREKRQVGSATDQMLADIPKYTANGRSALFLVFDAAGCIDDDEAFAAPLVSAGRARVHLIRR
jgi:hypothetical protein